MSDPGSQAEKHIEAAQAHAEETGSEAKGLLASAAEAIGSQVERAKDTIAHMTGLASDTPGEEQALRGGQERVQEGIDTAKAKGSELQEGASQKAQDIQHGSQQAFEQASQKAQELREGAAHKAGEVKESVVGHSQGHA